MTPGLAGWAIKAVWLRLRSQATGRRGYSGHGSWPEYRSRGIWKQVYVFGTQPATRELASI
jgi:hypothetical protein